MNEVNENSKFIETHVVAVMLNGIAKNMENHMYISRHFSNSTDSGTDSVIFSPSFTLDYMKKMNVSNLSSMINLVFKDKNCIIRGCIYETDKPYIEIDIEKIIQVLEKLGYSVENRV